MLVPLSLKGYQNRCLSIVKLKNGYSVKVVELVNGLGFESVPSYRYKDPDIPDEFGICVCMTDIPAIKGPNLFKCISEVMELVENP